MKLSIDKFSYSNDKKKTYKSPWAALLWSIAIPGFGQFYNRDYLLGIILIAWEILINRHAHVNTMILHSFRGQLEASRQVANLDWLMFYPSVFTYSCWQAYNQALSHNYEIKIEGHTKPYRPEFNFFCFGFVVGANFGIFYPFLVSPFFSGIVFGVVLGIIAHKVEKNLLETKGIEDE